MSESKNLWGGRFKENSDPGFAEFNRSFSFDCRLFEADVRAGIAHCNGLAGAGVLTAEEAAKIKKALNSMLEHGAADPEYFEKWPQEDIHTFVEAHLLEMAGDSGKKLHTGRSRNDQVATDLRLWLREAIDGLKQKLQLTQEALLDLAENHREAVLPGFTHLQRAQPILFSHWCLAYFEMFARDRDRLADVRKRVNVMPLGSGALAGTSYPIDREAVARELGFEAIARNSLDAVSDRDFCVEFVNAAALIMLHLSRLAEDIILYTTKEFGFIELGDAVATGSSLMPQKKNPDSMELMRGKAGRVFGHLIALMTMLKALPLAYNKDMQEDKEALFDTFDTVSVCLEVVATVLRNIKVNEDRTREAASSGYMNATELADYLVRKGMPFREAHQTVGRMVIQAIDRGIELEALSLTEMRSFSELIGEDVFGALTLESTLARKSQTGGTARERVAEALAAARATL
jgi:argininosuccinate lyase